MILFWMAFIDKFYFTRIQNMLFSCLFQLSSFRSPPDLLRFLSFFVKNVKVKAPFVYCQRGILCKGPFLLWLHKLFTYHIEHNTLRGNLTLTFRRIHMDWLFLILEIYQTSINEFKNQVWNLLHKWLVLIGELIWF